MGRSSGSLYSTLREPENTQHTCHSCHMSLKLEGQGFRVKDMQVLSAVFATGMLLSKLYSILQVT